MLTLSAIAVFLRHVVISSLVGRSIDQMPAWFVQLSQSGLAGIGGQVPQLPLSSFAFARDGVFYAVPMATGFPVVAQYLILAGAIAAALAAAATTAFALSAILAEDVLGGSKWEPASDAVRINTTRAMCVVVVVVGLVFYSLVKADPLDLFLSAMALSAASAFPVIVLSVWWKRMSAAGAGAAMIVGFSLVIALLLASAGNVITIATPIAGVLAASAAAVTALVVSLMTPEPPRAALEAARDMRIPGGETVYDREMRQLRFSQRGRE